MSRIYLVVALLCLGLGAVRAEDAPVLLSKYRCDLCHAEASAKTGPSYADLAARYRGDPKAEDELAALIRKGAHGGGPWHMPPHPEVSNADAKEMARYILSQGNR